MGVVVLYGEDIYFVDALHTVEGNLHPVRILACGRIVPAAARAPVDAFAVAVVDRGHGEVCEASAISARSACRAAVAGERDVLP